MWIEWCNNESNGSVRLMANLRSFGSFLSFSCWPWNGHEGTLISCPFLPLILWLSPHKYMQCRALTSDGNSIPWPADGRTFPWFLVVSRACRRPAEWPVNVGPAGSPYYRSMRFNSSTNTHTQRSSYYTAWRKAGRTLPDRERIRRTSSNILRLPRTFWPATHCTGDCKWIPAVSSGLP